MANFANRVLGNVPGDFFVDTTCIDCDTCRQLAPEVFSEGDGSAVVTQQPVSLTGKRQALHALVSCPTGSIGTQGELKPATVLDDFPLSLDGEVSYCGFNSPKSFGGNSYFIQRQEGNWLVDSPKFLPRLVQRFERLGGIAWIFLTHSDDVADAALYARHFGSRRVIHRAELHSQPESEVVLDGEDPVTLQEDFLAIPTPGHTAGHLVLLHRNRFLFTGDHLAWDRHSLCLTAHRNYCWYSWRRQIESMRRLVGYSFEWVLPGHGQRIWLPEEDMKQHLKFLVSKMV